jgi:hypothetical protein
VGNESPDDEDADENETTMGSQKSAKPKRNNKGNKSG